MAAAKTSKSVVKRPAKRPSRRVVVPGWVEDLETFRQWSDSPAFPEFGRVSFYDGHVVIDMSKEELFTHGLLKTLIAHILFGLAEAMETGDYWCDGAFVVNAAADLANVPDGVFVSHRRVERGLVSFAKGRRKGFMEIAGSPDMVLEIVSPSSVTKDKIRMIELYAAAGIPEYWLVDACGGHVEFDIRRLGPEGYVPVRRLDGWVKSAVFGKSFRLRATKSPAGMPKFKLDVK